VTNLWPHHLDRYDTFANYISAKLNIVGGIRFGSGLATQGKHELGSCVPPESIIVGEMHEDARTQLRERAPQGWRWVRDRGPIELRVPGRHNLANANCVLEVCEALGLDEITARGALAAFAGLPHRLQYVGTLDGVDYFNDSKSTSPSATVMAVESFDRPVIALVGGQDKDVPLEDFAHALIRKCRVVIGVGESKHAFLRAIRENGQAHGKERQLPQLFSAQGLDQALDLARRAAKPGEIIVFSPGAPSFDGYTNYAQRGEHFMRIVGSLAKSASKGDGAIPADGAQNDEA
jgi:UDP-N-acetylmuramoylalanine--D-glutamate ligase